MDISTQAHVRHAIKHYRTLDYSGRLIELLSRVYPDENLSSLAKLELHHRFNGLLLQERSCEHGLKSALFNYFCTKKVVAAFEIRVNDSRADFMAINGHTYNFEIKSGLDNLAKLSRQSANYIKVFEYNHVVIDERHLQNSLIVLPESFGVWSFHKGRKKVHRPATFNQQIDPLFQLRLLTKKELSRHFDLASHNDILERFDNNQINQYFKTALKERYISRWNFLLEHAAAILPIDLQFFFNRNIDPKYIYH